MRSYYEHLQMSVSGEKKKAVIAPKLTFRSSAIFPVMNRPGISSRILFLGYWILKRHIKQIAAVVTLRSETGDTLYRSNLLIEQAKTYRIELADLLLGMGRPSEDLFTGTLEIEFFSTANLVFPYPAVVINYYGPNFCSVVHTAQRVYNDFEDMRNNSQCKVAESGFNIYAEEDQEPFFGLINGPQPVDDCKVSMKFYNADKEVLPFELNLGKQGPYQLQMIYPSRHIDLKGFLKGKVGAGKIQFNVNWIFPRVLVGNINRSLPAVTITHTYYDCSQSESDSDYWLPTLPEWHPAALIVPMAIQGEQFTNIYFYPIYSPSIFQIDIEVYDGSGKCLGTKPGALKLESPSDDFKRIDLKGIAQELGIPETQDLAARVIARTVDDNRLPARVKLGLDVGQQLEQMPCNICTNLQPFNPGLEGKPSSFRWSPILADQPDASFWIMNSAPAVKYESRAEMVATFFREMDDATIVREVTLPPHGFIVIRVSEDSELKEFFRGKIGWCTVTTSNPYTTSYYFAKNPSGVVGGDHGF